MNIKLQLIRYLAAMNAVAFDSAMHSTAAFFGVAGAHAVSNAVPSLNGQQFAAIFLIAFGRGILKYVDEHPIEELLKSESRDPKPEMQDPKSNTTKS